LTQQIDTAYNCEIICANGEKFLINANRLHNQHLDNWKDWHCEAGNKRLWIEHDGSVYGGECKNDYLGNVFENWDILPEPTVCKQIRCTACTDDLLISKKIKDNL